MSVGDGLWTIEANMTGLSLETVLETRGLNAHCGKTQVLHGLTLKLLRGEVVALLGSSGSGKSTALRTIMGLVMPTGGEVLFAGQQIEGRPAHEIAKMGIGYVPQQRRVFGRMTVYENLEVGRRLGPSRKGQGLWTFDRVFQLLPQLGSMKQRFASELDMREQQLLVIARTLMGNPEVLLLDEPTHRLSPGLVDDFARTVDELRSEGLSILMGEQNVQVTQAVCDRAYLLEQGKIFRECTMLDLMQNEVGQQILDHTSDATVS